MPWDLWSVTRPTDRTPPSKKQKGRAQQTKAQRRRKTRK